MIRSHSHYLGCFLISVLLMPVTVRAGVDLSDSVIREFELKYGSGPAEQVRQWRDLLQDSKGNSEMGKLVAVNNFFNHRLKFIDDILHWEKNDYWATPFEFIGTGAGDCEDFSIAKYFSLLELGVPNDKLRITYVKALAYNKAHMVVTYFSEPGAIPLVLDNINPAIESADKRKDILPVYSFNGTGDKFTLFVHDIGAKVMMKRYEAQLITLEQMNHINQQFVEAMKEVGNLPETKVITEGVKGHDDFETLKSIGINGASKYIVGG